MNQARLSFVQDTTFGVRPGAAAPVSKLDWLTPPAPVGKVTTLSGMRLTSTRKLKNGLFRQRLKDEGRNIQSTSTNRSSRAAGRRTRSKGITDDR